LGSFKSIVPNWFAQEYRDEFSELKFSLSGYREYVSREEMYSIEIAKASSRLVSYLVVGERVLLLGITNSHALNKIDVLDAIGDLSYSFPAQQRLNKLRIGFIVLREGLERDQIYSLLQNVNTWGEFRDEISIASLELRCNHRENSLVIWGLDVEADTDN